MKDSPVGPENLFRSGIYSGSPMRVPAAAQQPYRRHELEVTIDRLHAVLDKHIDRLSGAERDDISRLIHALERIQQEVDHRGF